MHTGNGVVERLIQTLKNVIIANMEVGINSPESVNRTLRVMRFTIHTILKKTPFQLPHARKPRTEITNIINGGGIYLSNWSEMTISASNSPKIPFYCGRYGEGEITNHIIMAGPKRKRSTSLKNKNSVSYPFYFVEKNYNKKLLEEKFQSK